MARMAFTTDYTTLLLLLGPHNALEGFDRPDFLHPHFFSHCYTVDECKNVIQTRATAVRQIDIFLPHNAVDLTNFLPNLPSRLRNFHLYCETEDIVNQYKRLEISTICRRVFNTNRIEMELYKAAHSHLLCFIDNLQLLEEAGDENAADKLLEVGELFEQSARRINDSIRQKSGLPEQPAEREET